MKSISPSHARQGQFNPGRSKASAGGQDKLRNQLSRDSDRAERLLKQYGQLHFSADLG